MRNVTVTSQPMHCDTCKVTRTTQNNESPCSMRENLVYKKHIWVTHDVDQKLKSLKNNRVI